MKKVLERAEAELPELLKSLAGWNSLDVDYEPPRVERLWREFEGYRLYLHRIHPCERALYHPHPWPSIIKILSGGYEMGVGYGTRLEFLPEGEAGPPIAATLWLAPGTTYEMVHIDGWHYVKPSVENLSIMITGTPWDRWAPGPGPDVKLGPLKSEDAEALLSDFRRLVG